MWSTDGDSLSRLSRSNFCCLFKYLFILIFFFLVSIFIWSSVSPFANFFIFILVIYRFCYSSIFWSVHSLYSVQWSQLKCWHWHWRIINNVTPNSIIFITAISLHFVFGHVDSCNSSWLWPLALCSSWRTKCFQHFEHTFLFPLLSTFLFQCYPCLLYLHLPPLSLSFLYPLLSLSPFLSYSFHPPLSSILAL